MNKNLNGDIIEEHNHQNEIKITAEDYLENMISPIINPLLLSLANTQPDKPVI